MVHIKSMEMQCIDTSLVCTLCEGTGNLLKIEKGKPRFTACICFGGCLYL